MLKLSIKDWKERIDRQFEAGLFDNVVIDTIRKTKEITNFEYCLLPEEIVEQVAPPDKEEWEERNFVIKKSIDVSRYLCKDLSSRQAAFVNNYDGKDNHCISYFHFYIRDKKLSMNVYVRSMNYTENFVFDCQTFNLAYQEVHKRLNPDLFQIGYIRVFVFSLHVYV